MAQLSNKAYNNQRNGNLPGAEKEIVAEENTIAITTKVIYNAIPDGYHVTYTKSFIGKSVADVEQQMNRVKTIDAIRELSHTCLEYGIYDMIGAQAYLEDSKKIYDSLSAKAVQVLDMKKNCVPRSVGPLQEVR
ncbi:MAG TPA: hypothetical protein VNZ86_13845 [Bacteroidia bacterium]|jgi:hypothetical protein|nr:hypothetical protein [Bacteroidia bacterium]